MSRPTDSGSPLWCGWVGSVRVLRQPWLVVVGSVAAAGVDSDCLVVVGVGRLKVVPRYIVRGAAWVPVLAVVIGASEYTPLGSVARVVLEQDGLVSPGAGRVPRRGSTADRAVQRYVRLLCSRVRR